MGRVENVRIVGGGGAAGGVDGGGTDMVVMLVVFVVLLFVFLSVRQANSQKSSTTSTKEDRSTGGASSTTTTGGAATSTTNGGAASSTTTGGLATASTSGTASATTGGRAGSTTTGGRAGSTTTDGDRPPSRPDDRPASRPDRQPSSPPAPPSTVTPTDRNKSTDAPQRATTTPTMTTTTTTSATTLAPTAATPNLPPPTYSTRPPATTRTGGRYVGGGSSGDGGGKLRKNHQIRTKPSKQQQATTTTAKHARPPTSAPAAAAPKPPPMPVVPTDPSAFPERPAFGTLASYVVSVYDQAAVAVFPAYRATSDVATRRPRDGWITIEERNHILRPGLKIRAELLRPPGVMFSAERLATSSGGSKATPKNVGLLKRHETLSAGALDACFDKIDLWAWQGAPINTDNLEPSETVEAVVREVSSDMFTSVWTLGCVYGDCAMATHSLNGLANRVEELAVYLLNDTPSAAATLARISRPSRTATTTAARNENGRDASPPPELLLRLRELVLRFLQTVSLVWNHAVWTHNCTFLNANDKDTFDGTKRQVRTIGDLCLLLLSAYTPLTDDVTQQLVPSDRTIDSLIQVPETLLALAILRADHERWLEYSMRPLFSRHVARLSPANRARFCRGWNLALLLANPPPPTDASPFADMARFAGTTRDQAGRYGVTLSGLMLARNLAFVLSDNMLAAVNLPGNGPLGFVVARGNHLTGLGSLVGGVYLYGAGSNDNGGRTRRSAGGASQRTLLKEFRASDLRTHVLRVRTVGGTAAPFLETQHSLDFTTSRHAVSVQIAQEFDAEAMEHRVHMTFTCRRPRFALTHLETNTVVPHGSPAALPDDVIHCEDNVVTLRLMVGTMRFRRDQPQNYFRLQRLVYTGPNPDTVDTTANDGAAIRQYVQENGNTGPFASLEEQAVPTNDRLIQDGVRLESVRLASLGRVPSDRAPVLDVAARMVRPASRDSGVARNTVGLAVENTEAQDVALSVDIRPVGGFAENDARVFNVSLVMAYRDSETKLRTAALPPVAFLHSSITRDGRRRRR